ncbi:MMS19 nucleotide excision repair protein isoform X2 [Lycorma delicatula]|uniref:MMS19 nucleotide excision repair protein isoform X2 n=1 Tax=Lycorma delicatula TaxID=130591 RepID=UPI003F511643
MSLSEDTEGYLKEIENTPSEDLHSISNRLGQDVISGRLQLLKVVELLGPLLTNTETKQRGKGVLVLSQIIGSLKTDYLSAAELTFLTAFYCDRMKDHHSLATAVLQGVIALIDMDNLPSDSPMLVCTSLFNHIHCQTLKQPERNMVYLIFQKFLLYRIEDVKSMGLEFVLGFITAVDSERDPQNLILLFSILPKFLTSFPLLHLSEEAFSVISCYFPVDFNAGAEDEKTITRNDLALALAPCLVAVPEFAEYCIPLTLEKLDSNLHIAKLDSLHVLREGLKIWNIESIEPHLVDIWLSIKKELLPGSDAEVRNSSTLTLTSLIRKLNDTPDEKRESILKAFTDDIISSTSGLLSDMNLSLFGPAIHILVTSARASNFVCKEIISQVIPKLYELPQNTSQDTVIVIRTLDLFLKSELQHLSNADDSYSDIWSLYPDMLLSAACHHNHDVQAAAFEGLKTLVRHLSESNRNFVYQHCEIVLSSGNELVKENCIRFLKSSAELYPLEVMKNMVQSKLLIDKGCPDIDKQKWRIETLCALIMLPEFIEPVSDILLSLVDECCDFTSVVLHSIRSLLNNADLNDPAIKILCETITKRIVLWWINGLQQAKYPEIFNNEEVLLDSAAIVECLIRNQNSSLQIEVISPLLQVIIPMKESGNGLNNLGNDYSSSPNSVILLEGLLESLHEDVTVPGWQILTTALSNIAFNSSHSLAQLSASRLLATLMNKQQNDESMVTVLGNIAKCLEERLSDKNTEVNAVRLLSWIAKALVLRGHGLMSYWLDKLTEQLSNKRIGKIAAEGFRLIMSEDKLHLTTKSHCTVRILYRQRLFQRIPALVSVSRNCHPSCKVNYLLAIAYFVQAVPRIVLLPHLRQVILPMVESLDCDEGELELTTLETLSSLLLEKESALESYTDTFIPRFLTLAQQSSYMKVRIAALSCLKNYADYSQVLLMPYVQTVIYELATCLDDKKRLVRKAAVDARSRWFLIGSPSEDDD